MQCGIFEIIVYGYDYLYLRPERALEVKILLLLCRSPIIEQIYIIFHKQNDKLKNE